MTRKIFVLGFLFALTSCTQMYTNVPPGGMHQPGSYLASLGAGGASPGGDSVSYWDGDGVQGPPSVTIDLGDQRAYFYKGGKLVGVSKISSGTPINPTPTGSFKVSQKNENHRSNLYGEIVDAAGNVINKEADSRVDKVPPGGRFVGAKMPFFMRFNGGVGMHAGYLPGFPASHGCVRMPDRMAKIFFYNVSHGTPVTVVP